MEGQPDFVDGVRAQTREQRPDLDDGIVELLTRTTRLGRLVEERTRRSLEPYGLALGDFWVLVALRRSGSPFRLSPSELLRRVTVTSGAISQQIERLEKRGAVRRRQNANDRRGVLVELTPEGLALIDDAWTAHVQRDAAIFEVLTPAQRTRLAELLKRIGDGPAAPV